jgi:hypothetical protein
MNRNLQAEIREIAPVASIHTTNGVCAYGRTGKASRRICASIERRQRAVCTVSESLADWEERSGGFGAQLDTRSSGLNASSENCLWFAIVDLMTISLGSSRGQWFEKIRAKRGLPRIAQIGRLTHGSPSEPETSIHRNRPPSIGSVVSNLEAKAAIPQPRRRLSQASGRRMRTRLTDRPELEAGYQRDPGLRLSSTRTRNMYGHGRKIPESRNRLESLEVVLPVQIFMLDNLN